MDEKQLKKAIQKYLDDKNILRLSTILTSNGIKDCKNEREKLKLLIEDYSKDDDISPILSLFRTKNTDETVLDLDSGPANEDELEILVKRAFGNPLDNSSLGNKIIRREVLSFHVQSYINPDILFAKFCAMAGKTEVLIDFHPMSLNGIPLFSCIVSGSGSLKRLIEHRVD